MTESMPSTEPPASPAPSVRAAAAHKAYELSVTTPCVQCGYDLRGLTSDGRCPECGTPIPRSLDGHLLRYAPPGYVRTLAVGLALMVTTVPLWLGTWIVLEMLFPLRLVGPEPPDAVFEVLGALFKLALLLPEFIGVWLVTIPDPVKAYRKPASNRRIVRITFILCLGAGIILDLLALFTDPLPWSLVELVGWALVIVGVVGFFAWFTYLRHLATRLPNRRLAADARILMWAIAACVVVSVLLGVVEYSTLPPGGHGYAVFVIQFTMSVTVMVLSLWSLLLMARTCRQLLKSAKAAATNQAAGVRRADDSSMPVIHPHRESRHA